MVSNSPLSFANHLRSSLLRALVEIHRLCLRMLKTFSAPDACDARLIGIHHMWVLALAQSQLGACFQRCIDCGMSIAPHEYIKVMYEYRGR
jgi:hypothetical protein